MQDREKFYQEAGLTPGEPLRKPNPPPDHGWGAEVSDEDLQVIDPQAFQARQNYLKELREYTVSCLEDYAKERTAQFSDMPLPVQQRVTAKISERLTQEPTIYFDAATGELNQARYRELCDASLTEACNATGYSPRQDVASYIQERQASNPTSAVAQLANLGRDRKEK